jgi:hypothetical protein
MLGSSLLMLLVILLFEKEIGSRREERARRLVSRDRQDRVTVFGAESAQHIQHLARLAHRLPNVPECIGQLLEAAYVLGDVHVALHQVPELRLLVYCTMELVVAELVMDGLPDAERRGLRGAHDVAHVLGDGDVQLADDALVDDGPLGVVALFGGWLKGDVRDKIELAEESIEEASPLIVVGIGELKDDGDVGFDVYSLENGDRRSGDAGTISGGVGHAIEGRHGGGVTV